ncbi:unnamed protein product [Cyclocybe aegerita]|uniref:Glycoside hydrolase 131 catalytic N-terminal domain-containing protein n=1 Tax=Cyclocybe aegerita TaxID=1973307 RepID=A0A8S0W8P3_CYCAE|nr:unnamed protein product [Cyclocybe aegerita]
MVAISLLFTLSSVMGVLSAPTRASVRGPILYDGRAPLNFSAADLDASKEPFLTVVKGSNNASQYTQLLGTTELPTPLWNTAGNLQTEQVLAASIDNSSIFTPGGFAQNGFRRTDIIAQQGGSPANLLNITQVGTTVFHFSVKTDETRPLNDTHEYQPVFIEPNDGTHIFDLQLGSPFTNPTGDLPAANARNFRVRNHAGQTLFESELTNGNWHNFAVQVDWDNRTLAVLYSIDCAELQPVTGVEPNESAAPGLQGEFHFGLLKLPLVNPADSPEDQNNVVAFGIQEGTLEALKFSGIFVEGTQRGIRAGNGRAIRKIRA